MDTYITGAAIRSLREKKGITQAALAEKLCVSAKAVSKWETGRGLPDITLLEPLAAALGVSLAELLSGRAVTNRNVSANMRRSKFYVCPLCGNVLHGMGEAQISCCGISLPPLEAEDFDAEHELSIEKVEDEYFISLQHEMTRGHFISFIAFVTDDRLQLVKLYPQWGAQARVQRRGMGDVYIYCNKHGLMRGRV